MEALIILVICFLWGILDKKELYIIVVPKIYGEIKYGS